MLSAFFLDRVPTGIKGLDELLGGGFPDGRCILIVGSPGSGKTTFALQYLYHGAMLGETGLYVTLDEHPDHVKRNLQSYDWDIDGMEKKGKLLFIDASGLRRAGGESNRLSPNGGSGADVFDFTIHFNIIQYVCLGADDFRIAFVPLPSVCAPC